MTEDEMVRWYHLPNGHEFEQALGDSEGQGSLACCSPWGSKVSDMTERLSNNNCFYFCLVSSGVLFTTMSHRNKTLNRLHGGSIHFFSSSKAFLYSFINGRTVQISPCFLTLEVCSQCERRVQVLSFSIFLFTFNSQLQVQITRCISVWHHASISTRISNFGL